jgi:hypothetical protein
MSEKAKLGLVLLVVMVALSPFILLGLVAGLVKEAICFGYSIVGQATKQLEQK